MSRRIPVSLLCLFLAVDLSAQPGAIDGSFNPADVGFGNVSGADNWVHGITLQPDGKVLIGGLFGSYGGTSRVRVARLEADGSLDPTFDPGIGPNATVHALAVQPDGKVVIGGAFTTCAGTSRNRIARLNADGSLDASFDPGTGADGVVYAVALQADGKILIGGAFAEFNGDARLRIARLHPDGSLDTTFITTVNGSPATIHCLALRPGGQVLAGGDFVVVNGFPSGHLVQLTTDGVVDLTFNTGTGPTDPVRSMFLQADGNLLIGGSFDGFNGAVRHRLARVASDGSLDPTFDPGPGADGPVLALAQLPGGQVVAGGWFSSIGGTPHPYFAGFNADGSLDPAFLASIAPDDQVLALTVQPDGNVLVGGGFSTFQGVPRDRITRVQPDGAQDPGFLAVTGADNAVWCMDLQPDGKALIGGTFGSFNGVGRSRIARLESDGELDVTFDPGAGADLGIRDLVLQADGKVLIGGAFTTVDGVSRSNVARLNADGSLDTGFDPGSGMDIGVWCLALQPDGKVLAGGLFHTFDGVPRERIVRMNSDGSLDPTFDPGLGANDLVWCLAVQPDGKVLVGGRFTTFNGTPRNRIARLNADGSLDTTFDPGTGTSPFVIDLALQPDGRVLIGGAFTTVAGTPRNRIARLNTDGSLDGTFDPGTGADDLVRSIAVQPDGKVLVGGWFSQYDGSPRERLARLLPDGSLDAAFDPGSGADDDVEAVEALPDGRVLIGGSFTSYDGTGRNRICRVLGDASSDISTVPATGTSALNALLASGASLSVALFDIQGRMFATRTLSGQGDLRYLAQALDPDLPGGLYLLKIHAEGREFTERLMLAR